MTSWNDEWGAGLFWKIKINVERGLKSGNGCVKLLSI